MYVLRIRPVVRLLGYGEPRCWKYLRTLCQIDYIGCCFLLITLHEAVETAKRFLTKEKIDRQMTGQSSTPFMKLNDKKRKTVSFDTRGVLERTSENMEWMMALMDKMYIKLDQKEVPYKPQIYQRGREQNRCNFRQSNNWRRNRSFSRECGYNNNRAYGRGRSNFRRGSF